MPIRRPPAASLTTPAARAPIRTRYIRNDQYYNPNEQQYHPPHFTVYDSLLKRFFVSNPFMNRIDVFDAVQEVEIGSVPVPAPWGMDVSLDGTTIWVTTYLGDVYAVDAGILQIIRRYPGATLGTTGYSPNEVFVMADGRLALLGERRPMPADGAPESFAIWDPADNSLVIEHAIPFPKVCSNLLSLLGAFALSGDRTRILVGSRSSDGGLCSYDPKTRQWHTATMNEFVSQLIPTPDGKRVFVMSESGNLAVLDPATLAPLATFSAPPPTCRGVYGSVMSLDGKVLYLVDLCQQVVAYDTTTLLPVGWVPNFLIGDMQNQIVPAAIDETGLIVGPIGHGVAFIDASQLQTTALPPDVGMRYLTPSTGPTAGGTPISVLLDTGAQHVVPGVKRAYVGSSLLTNASATSTSLAGKTAPGAPGAADLTVVFGNNNVGIMPEAYSYGPTIVELSTTAATAEGGAQGILFGYGLGQKPADVQVTVGGQPATILGVQPPPLMIPYPFPTGIVWFRVPPGAQGSVVDVTVKTAAGSATLPSAFRYLPAVLDFPIANNTLEQGVFDSRRRMLYFTDATQIQVFSPAAGKWLPPIPIPGASRLWGISLSPDGNILAVGDINTANIYVLNPDSPATIRTFPVQQTPLEIFYATKPVGVAVTNSGVVYYSPFHNGGPGFYKLDTSTGTVSIPDPDRHLISGSDDKYTRVLLTPDGSRVYCANPASFYLDTASDVLTVSERATISYNYHDLAMSGDGRWLAPTGYLADLEFNPLAMVSYVDRDAWVAAGVYGYKLSHDGSLLFQPLTNGIDIVSGTTGLLLERVTSSIQIADVYDALVIDDPDQLLFAITPTGIVELDLKPLPRARHVPSVVARNPVSDVIGTTAVPNPRFRMPSGVLRVMPAPQDPNH